MHKYGLNERQRQIATFAATTAKQKKEIAEIVGVHPNTITRILKMPEVQAYMTDLRNIVQERVIIDLCEAFDSAAIEAFRKLLDLMHNAPPGVALRAVESVLDRSQNAPKRQIHTKKEVDGRYVVAHIPASCVPNMIKALEDTDSYETLRLLPKGAEERGISFETDIKTGEIVREWVPDEPVD
jgi:hypothetical protein